MEKTDILIIGAGVVGLAIAAKVARSGRGVIIVDKNPQLGMETSSRNSEVIHSGIYYPQGTLKAVLCIKGNPMIYEYCRAHNIKHNNIGKIVIARSEAERAELQRLKKIGTENGAEGLELLSQSKLAELEPEVKALEGLMVPSTGIFDTDSFMHSLLAAAKEKDCIASFSTEVSAIQKTAGGYAVSMKDGFEIESAVVINAAGLWCDKIAAMAGIDIDAAGYRIHWSKGQYFRTSTEINVQRLIYPVPDNVNHSLGIHFTRDLAGGRRFGPDAHYVTEVDYTINDNARQDFHRAIQTYLPQVTLESLYADTAGVRPKLQGPKDPFRDFIICHETTRNLPGFMNLIGIESPGLTSSLAIADHVASLLSL